MGETEQGRSRSTTGTLALVGGDEWSEGCDFDRLLLEASGASEVVVLPTAAAYERPEKAVATAEAWFGHLGATVRPLMVLKRHEAEDPENAAVARDAGFLYLSGGSPLHLRSVLAESALWDAMCDAWRSGAVLAGSSAGAMVLGDPLLDPRGGAFTLGLGLLPGLSVMPHAESRSADTFRRTLELAPPGTRLVGIDSRTALVRAGDGQWSTQGAGEVKVWVDGEARSLDVLAGT